MGAEQRRFPRTARSDTAEIRHGRESFAVVIHSLSPEGGGFMVAKPVPGCLAKGQRVNVRLVDQDIELPARVAWSATGNDEWGFGGLHFQLALAASSQRQKYAEWVVGLLRRDLAL